MWYQSGKIGKRTNIGSKKEWNRTMSAFGLKYCFNLLTDPVLFVTMQVVEGSSLDQVAPLTAQTTPTNTQLTESASGTSQPQLAAASQSPSMSLTSSSIRIATMTCWRWVMDQRKTWIFCSLPPKRPWILSCCCFPLRCTAGRTSQLLSWPSFAPPPPPPCKCQAPATCWPCASSPMPTSAVEVSMPVGPKSKEVEKQLTAQMRKNSLFITQLFCIFVLTGCGGPVVAHSGEIHSPAYPNSYPHNVDCSWVISVDPSHRVFLNFSDLDIELHTACSFDYVVVSFTHLSHLICIKDQHPNQGKMLQIADVP